MAVKSITTRDFPAPSDTLCLLSFELILAYSILMELTDRKEGPSFVFLWAVAVTQLVLAIHVIQDQICKVTGFFNGLIELSKCFEALGKFHPNNKKQRSHLLSDLLEGIIYLI